ncbi:IclR family transcriptional regulator [uncultured Sunxiuqinia sp.]|uniref:IclR family transcriptional regulator n=1 Tax=uncultured Sunxiuqinia sp. TaxID=1573825 RepID=UPI002603FEA2|nr:IclR family transcriptional regulator [uncultured Sunxiuqinia sp.]
MNKQPNTVPNIDKAIAIIEILSRHPNGMTLQALIDMTGLAKTSVFRILNTFVNHGYLYKETNSCFRLTKKFLTLGLAGMGNENLIEKSLSIMRLLKDEINETVLLGTMVDDKIVMLEQVIGNHPFTFYLRPGKKVEMHISAPGKAYLAFCDKQEREAIIDRLEMKRYNQNSITDKSILRKHLKGIKEQGYAIDCAEEMEGVHCISAPIFSSNGQPVALIWTTGPSSRLLKEDFDKNGKIITQYALEISKQLGYIND